MRLLFICPGSRGDFEPLLAVAEALALVEPGGVCIAAHAFFKEETEAAGCAFAPLSGSPSGGSDGASWATQLDEAAALAHGASFSAVVANWFATPAALSLAELHGLPVLLLWPGAPLLRTAAFACPLVGGGDALRGWSLFDAALWRSQRPVLNAWRARLGMPPLGELSSLSAQAAALRAPVLLPFSPLVLPRPPDWPPRAVLTGAWRRRPPHDYTPPPGLLAFLEAPGVSPRAPRRARPLTRRARPARCLRRLWRRARTGRGRLRRPGGGLRAVRLPAGASGRRRRARRPAPAFDPGR